MDQNSTLDQKYEVSPLELSFDLIYAFALSQVSEAILADLTWITLLKGTIILGAVYMIWSYTSWAATMISVEHAKTRRMIIAVMILGFIMNASIGQAFIENGYIFIGIYLLIQFGRILWTYIHSPNPEFKEHFKRVLIWQCFSTPFWIIGLFNSYIIHLISWSIAIIVDITGTWMAHPIFHRRLQSEEVPFDDEHLLERCRLFRIIAFGEIIFSSGEALKEAHLSMIAIFMGCLSVVEVIALWSLTFGKFVHIIAQHRESQYNPILTSRYAINALVIILLGIVNISVGNKYIILNPCEELPTIIIFILITGPIMFLLAQGWYLYKVPKTFPTLYVLSGCFLLIIGIIGASQPASIFHILLSSILVVISFLDVRKDKNSMSI